MCHASPGACHTTAFNMNIHTETAGHAPAHRAAAREHTPDDTRSGGGNEQPAAKRSRTDGGGGAAEPAAKQARTGDNGNVTMASAPASAHTAGRTAPLQNGIASAAQQQDLQPCSGRLPAPADSVAKPSGSTAQPQPQPQPQPPQPAGEARVRTTAPGAPFLSDPSCTCLLPFSPAPCVAVPIAGTHTWAMAQAWLRLPLLPRSLCQACRPRLPAQLDNKSLCSASSCGSVLCAVCAQLSVRLCWSRVLSCSIFCLAARDLIILCLYLSVALSAKTVRQVATSRRQADTYDMQWGHQHATAAMSTLYLCPIPQAAPTCC